MGSESSECAWSKSNLRWFGHQSRLVRGPLGAAPGPAAVCPWSTGHFAADAPCAFNSDFASDVNSVPLLAIQCLLIGGDRRPAVVLRLGLRISAFEFIVKNRSGTYSPTALGASAFCAQPAGNEFAFA